MLELFKSLAEILHDYKEYAFMAIIMVCSGTAIVKLYGDNKRKEQKILELAMNVTRARLKTAEVLRDLRGALEAIERKISQ